MTNNLFYIISASSFSLFIMILLIFVSFKSLKKREKIFNRNSFSKELRVSDVANTILYLLSDQSIGITGQVVHVDNGTI